MKFCIFTDPHYCAIDEIGTRRPKKSLEKFTSMLGEINKEGVANLICLGDIIFSTVNGDKMKNIENYSLFISSMARFNMKMFLVLGNHDMEALTNSEYIELSSDVKIAPFIYDTGERLLIFLDANYNKDGTAYQTGANDWRISYVPHFQLEMLERNLSQTDKEAVIFIHQNLDDRPSDPHIVRNAAQVRAILERSGKVKQVYQGHYHPGSHSVCNGIEYITLKAMCELDTVTYMIVDL